VFVHNDFNHLSYGGKINNFCCFIDSSLSNGKKNMPQALGVKMSKQRRKKSYGEEKIENQQMLSSILGKKPASPNVNTNERTLIDHLHNYTTLIS